MENRENPIKIDLSIPYFSKDKRIVIILYRYNNTSALMVGGATLLKHTKTKYGWKKETIISNLH